MGIGLIILKSLYFMLPAYFANMAPVIVRNWIKSFNTAIDFGKKWKGKPIFGKNKTWRGLIFGVIFGIIVAYAQYLINSPWNLVDYSDWFLIGGLMGFGAILGDMIESFIKRRIGIKSGQPFIPWDQIDFIIGGLLFSFFLIPKELLLTTIITIIIISPFLHMAVNHFAYYLKIRNEKW